MKLTFQVEDRIVTIESSKSIDIQDAIELIKSALLAVGFHPDNIDAYFSD